MEFIIKVKKIKHDTTHIGCADCTLSGSNYCKACDLLDEIYVIVNVKPLNKVVEDGQAKWCPLFEECKFRQERGCDMKCRYYYPPAT